MSPITTHILDVSTGRPASGVEVALHFQDDTGHWNALGAGVTDEDGREKSLLEASSFKSGSYRLTFAVGSYFERTQRPCFYADVQITFKVDATDEHYHVPLLLSPFGYSTYRGS